MTWRSKKRHVVARSSAEAEFRALSLGIREWMRIKRLLDELKIEGSHPVELLCDNQAAISMSRNPVHYERIKHVKVDRHFISED